MIDGEDVGAVVGEDDWEHLLDGIPIPEDTALAADDDELAFLSIEQFLMNDNDVQHLDHGLTDRYFSDVFVEESSDEVRSETDKVNDVALQRKEEGNLDHGQDESDPLAKKRKSRQMRNREAAVRSRERKKMHVKDLEMKSKYFEAECRRLGMLLQWCVAENHAMRISLHNSKAVVGASMTKQESAVLLLESLLLGSLLWFLGIIIIICLPGVSSDHHQKTLGPMDMEDRASLKGRSRMLRNFTIFKSIRMMMGKRCKASRSRMKIGVSFALEYNNNNNNNNRRG